MEFIVSFFRILFIILEKILGFLLSMLESIFGVQPAGGGKHDSTFGKASAVLSSWNKGFMLNGKASLTLQDSFKNVLVVGSTGTGKSTCVILPHLLQAKPITSFIVTDPSRELYGLAGGKLANAGFNILYINPSDPEHSEGFNPLSYIRNDQDIQKIASILVQNSLSNGKRGGDPFWELQATSLLSLMITIVRELYPEYLNLYNVRHLLNLMSGGKEDVALVDDLFSRTGDETLFAEYKSFLNLSDNTFSSVIASCKAATQIFSNPAVAKVTSVDTLNLQDLRDKPTVLFIATSVADQKYYSVLNAVFFEMLFGFFLQRLPQKDELPVLMLVDEAATVLARVPTLTTALSNLRKFRVGGLYAIQSYSQIEHSYGKEDAATLIANCYARLYLGGGGQSMETYFMLEKTLGRTTHKNGDNGSEKILPLMAAEHIRTMKATQALLIAGNQPGILLRLYPYYKNWTLTNRSKLPAPELIAKIPDGPVPLIQFDFKTLI